MAVGDRFGQWVEVDLTTDQDAVDHGETDANGGRYFTSSPDGGWPRIGLSAYPMPPTPDHFDFGYSLGGIKLYIQAKKKLGHHWQECSIPPDLIPVVIEVLTAAAGKPAE